MQKQYFSTDSATVVVPVLQAETSIQALLDGLLLQDTSLHTSYVFVDGGSTDRSLEYLHRFAQSVADVQIITCLDGLAASRRAGVLAATGDLVAFIDADCIPPPDWLEQMAKTLGRTHKEDPQVVGVGGSNIPLENSNLWQKTIGLMKDSFLGSYNSVYGRQFPSDRYVDHIATVNAMFFRRVLTADLFLKELSFSGEDIYIAWKLQKAGHRFVYAARGTIHHRLRTSLEGWIRNMFQYGRGRIHVILLVPVMALQKPLFLAPLCLVLLPIGLIFETTRTATIYLLGMYGVVILGSSLWVTATSGMYFLLPRLIVLYVCTHVSYGIGEIVQVFLYPFSKR